MSIVDQINKLTVSIDDEKSFKVLVESLEKYHEMIQEGLLKPRENRIQSMYIPNAFYSNKS